MILVLLGAGASYDSIGGTSLVTPPDFASLAWRPPLTDDLFGNRQQFAALLDQFPALRGKVVELRAKLQSGVIVLEAALAELEEAAKTDARSAEQMMALRFYIRSLCWECSSLWPQSAYGATNYHALVGTLDERARATGERVLYVTFNYDTLLEQSMADEMKTAFDTTASYVANGRRTNVFKPHGSWNWAHRVSPVSVPVGQSQDQWLMENALNLKVSEEIEIRRDWRTGVRGTAWVPALALPVQNKSHFVWPADQQERLVAQLPEVNRILVIGWRAMERHFLALLHQYLQPEMTRVLIANKTLVEGQEAWDRLRIRVGSRLMTIRGGADPVTDLEFSSLFASPEYEAFLA